MTNFGIHTSTALPSNGTVIANDVSTFLNESIAGGAITAYDIVRLGGEHPVALGQDRFGDARCRPYRYLESVLSDQFDRNRHQPAWQNAGVNYTFGANGQLNPPVNSVTLPNVTVNGVSLGNVQISHNVGGITQFADSNGNAQVNMLQQNGFPAGSLQSVAVSDKGRIVGTYSNGRTVDLAEITLANFNGANKLKRIDGGAFEATAESGTPTYNRARQDRRLLARGLQHRHRRRVHQAHRHPAGLFGQHQGDHDQQPDGSGSPEHAAVAVQRAAR